jgi:hypothetical protein
MRRKDSWSAGGTGASSSRSVCAPSADSSATTRPVCSGWSTPTCSPSPASCCWAGAPPTCSGAAGSTCSLGLAVLATIATDRAHAALAAGQGSVPAALNSGYSRAFVVAAGLSIAAALAAFLVPAIRGQANVSR